ncbi:MAG: hypothetical protein J6Y28_04975 [Acholeplasmatales bacterium]|nr:hypothetical protein [Methanobrevibacter sp.]MBP5445509.1 hypothetical protein [Acholeplasmatales bacterium]
MKIIYEADKIRYFDNNGHEIHENDIVDADGSMQRVYETENGELGTDATNPKWIKSGRAVPCEYGIYPFEEQMNVKLIKFKIVEAD